MRAARYRLRFVPGIQFSEATYGTDNFGGPITYGQRATDPLTAWRYRVVPLPAGYPTAPAWVMREGDIRPTLRAQILGDNSLPLDLTIANTVTLYLTGHRTGNTFSFPMVVATPKTNGIVTTTFTGHELSIPQDSYRVVIRILSNAQRWLTVPTHDLLELQIVPIGVPLPAPNVAPPPPPVGDEPAVPMPLAAPTTDPVLIGEIWMRSDDQLPTLALAVEDDDGKPVDLTPAEEIWIVLAHADGGDPRFDIPPEQQQDPWVIPASLINVASSISRISPDMRTGRWISSSVRRIRLVSWVPTASPGCQASSGSSSPKMSVMALLIA